MTSKSGVRRTITTLLFDTLDDLAMSRQPTTEASAVGGAPADDASKQNASTLGALLDALDERAFGLMFLLLALPCSLPFLYGIPQIVALPMIALTAQLALGRQDPWLPKSLRDRSFDIAGMRKIVDRAKRYLGWVERLAHPRLSFLTEGRPVQIIGALMLIPCASILLPLPLTNTTPGIGVAIAAVGLIERDGVLVVLGLLMGLVWVALLMTLFIIFGAEAAEILKEFIKSMVPGQG